MKRWPTGLVVTGLLPCLWVAAGLGASSLAAAPTAEPRLPWREAGLRERAAAAHLLNRFTFGPRPREIDHVVEIGLEAWLERQLEGSLEESGHLRCDVPDAGEGATPHACSIGRQ